jgi:uncharacterized protein (DUF608 family)
MPCPPSTISSIFISTQLSRRKTMIRSFPMSDDHSNDAHDSETQHSIQRREFIKLLGFGAASAVGAPGLMAGPFSEAKPGFEELIPRDKKLRKEWLDSLFERGSSHRHQGTDLATIGMPVGGLCAGQLYLQGDGSLACWQIFNKHHFSGYGATNYQYRTPESPLESGFALLLKRDGKETVIPFGQESFPEVSFTGEYPIGTLRYERQDLPVTTRMEAFSPFIPLNEEDSALPLTIFEFTFKNTSNKAVDIGLAGWLENGVCFHSAGYRTDLRTTAFAPGKEWSSILHGVASAPPEKVENPRPARILADFEGEDYGDWIAEGEAFGAGPASGTLPNQQEVSGFEGEGLVNTYIDRDTPKGALTSPEFTIDRRFLNFLIGGGSQAGKTCLNLIVDGKVVRTATGKNSERLAWETFPVFELEGSRARIQIVDDSTEGWGHINVDQIQLGDVPVAGPAGPVQDLEDAGTMGIQLLCPGRPWIHADSDDAANWLDLASHSTAYPINERKIAGIATRDWIRLEPQASTTVRAVLAWNFPNREQGNFYATRFADAQEVLDYACLNMDRLSGQTHLWHDTYYDSTLPYWLLDRLIFTASNIATGTCQWWANGRFWAWEGVGCCHGTCTHVWNYAHSMARLFPGLEKSARVMQDLGVALHDNGLVGFRGDLNGAYAADGQAGTVLKCYREHQMSADASFLKENWSKIKRVLEFSIAQDGNEDGLIENSQHNTFDINFEGPNTFVGSLYLSALRAGEEMAREMGETDLADRLHAIFESGSRKTLDRLWNGEYFIQDVDLEKYPDYQYGEGCLSDQMFGQGWAHLLGLGYLYPRENVEKTLQSVWTYNWTPNIAPYNHKYKPERWFIAPGEAGLFTCTWPKSAFINNGVRYRSEVWTGIEYQVAGHMIWEGMLTEGLAIIRAVHDRYHPSRHNPYNEVECGDHYARALASWGAYAALSGFVSHGPGRHLQFAPRMTPGRFKAAFTTAQAWGSFQQSAERGTLQAQLDVRWGTLPLQSFAIGHETRPTQVKVTKTENGALPTFQFTWDPASKLVKIQFSREIQIPAGESIEIQIA